MANYFVHPQAIVEPGAQVGENTRIWAFSHVLSGAVIGSDCNICDGVFVENQVFIGNRVTIKCGVQIWDGITLEDDVFIGPNATFTNDPFPRSKCYLNEYPHIIVKKKASIGANATILPGIVIGEQAMVGAGAVVTKDVPSGAIVVGNPARVRGYVDGFVPAKTDTPDRNSKISNCQLIDLPKVSDPRGNLTFIEAERHVPFDIKRVYYLYDVPGGAQRGGHAHKQLHQLLIAMSGSFDVLVDDGYQQQRFHLNRSYFGLYIPPMIWREIDNFSSGSVCMALVSAYFSEDDYYRDYEAFLKAVRS